MTPGIKRSKLWSFEGNARVGVRRAPVYVGLWVRVGVGAGTKCGGGISAEHLPKSISYDASKSNNFRLVSKNRLNSAYINLT